MDGSLEGSGEQLARARAILIAGPTASGKSALAIDLARRLDGVVVNADSMQLYRDLSIVSARPSAAEEEAVPHRLYGVLAASEAFSTGAWLRRMADELGALRAAEKVPVLVGGTGLYFKALTEGFADLPDIPPEIRAGARQLAEQGGVEALKQALHAAGDADAAATLTDPQRLARALEVVRATGHPLARWTRHHQADPLLAPDHCLRIVLAPPRPWLHARIAERAERMMSAAGLDEVRLLLAQKLPSTLPAMRAIGVKEIGGYLAGDTDLSQAIHRLTVATRQYAKRQETWFRNQMGDWQRLDPAAGIDADFLVQSYLQL